MNQLLFKKRSSLLFLATIDPSGVFRSRRNNAKIRLDDTISSLKKWISCGIYSRIIIIENSNSKEFQSYCSTLSDKYKDINFSILSYNGQNFDRSLGKGWGYYDSVHKAFDAGMVASDVEYLTMTSGRYYIKNVKDIIDLYQGGLQANLQNNLTYAFNPITTFPVSFVKSIWLQECSMIDESLPRGSFEYKQANAILKGVASGLDLELPYSYYDYEGIVSATTNKKYKRGFLHTTIIKALYKIKVFSFKLDR